jgi:hypothetical protein
MLNSALPRLASRTIACSSAKYRGCVHEQAQTRPRVIHTARLINDQKEILSCRQQSCPKPKSKKIWSCCSACGVLPEHAAYAPLELSYIKKRLPGKWPYVLYHT